MGAGGELLARTPFVVEEGARGGVIKVGKGTMPFLVRGVCVCACVCVCVRACVRACVRVC